MFRTQLPQPISLIRHIDRIVSSAASPATQRHCCDTFATTAAHWIRPGGGATTASSSTATGTTTIRRNFHGTSYRDRPLSPERHATTILCVRKNGKVCMMGDGMVSQGPIIVKPNVVKIRRILPKDRRDDNNQGTIVGFAGATADAFTLLERLEGKLDEYPGQLSRSCVELAKGWRTDKYLRRLEASLIVADQNVSLEISGNGDVLESYDDILGVGSGSPYAIAAARVLMEFPDLTAEEVARKSMNVAADMCVYTNHNFRIEVIDSIAGDSAKELEKKKKAEEAATMATTDEETK